MRVGFFALHLRKTKGAEPKLRAFVFDRRWAAGLSDDLGSLREDRDGDRSKQSEGGGDRSKLGHGVFPHGVQCLLTMRCRGRRAWMRGAENFCASFLHR